MNTIVPLPQLGYIRKVVERSLDSSVKEVAKFHWSQSTFKKGRGVEHPLLRVGYATQARQNDVAILYIKGAYSSVPKTRLRLPQQLVAMVSVLLTPDVLSTVGDITERTAMLRRGVP